MSDDNSGGVELVLARQPRNHFVNRGAETKYYVQRYNLIQTKKLVLMPTNTLDLTFLVPPPSRVDKELWLKMFFFVHQKPDLTRVNVRSYRVICHIKVKIWSQNKNSQKMSRYREKIIRLIFSRNGKMISKKLLFSNCFSSIFFILSK